MKVSIYFFPNPSKRSQKTRRIPIYLRVCFRRSKSESRLNAEITDEEVLHWDSISMRLQLRNSAINHQLNRFEQKFNDFILLNSTSLSKFTAGYIKDFVLGNNNEKQKTVLEFVDDYFTNAVANNVNRMPGTVKNYRRSINHIRQFLIHRKQEKLLLSQLNFEIADDFKSYLVSSNKDLNRVGMTEVSAAGVIKKFRTIFTKLQTEITGAGYNAYSLTSINQYLQYTYQDTISTVLYAGLQQCGQPYFYNCRDTSWTCYPHGQPTTCTMKLCDTLFNIPLVSAQNLPVFLNCGFNKSNSNCFDCNYFKSLDSSFYAIFNRHPVFTGTITNDTVAVYNDLFAKYVNFKSGLQKSWQYYAERFNATSCGIGGISGSGAGLSICLDRKPLNDTTGFTPPVAACRYVRNQATIKAGVIYEYNRQQTLANFKAAYLAKCLGSPEVFKVTDTIKEYHYTLYYFDQAENLIKVVPPKGVNPIYRQSWLDSVELAKANGSQLVPQHNLITRSSYNSLNQVTIQKSPDVGSRKFYYDRLGRLVLSQDANQGSVGDIYSYTLYDSLGRINENGQINGTSTMTAAISKSESSLQSWFAAATATRSQVTQTVYDIEYGAINGVVLSQKNLRNRVSYSQIINSASDTYPASATYYSYDIHGNVDTVLQDFGNSGGVKNPMNQSSNRFKRVVYDFDLLSGNINQVSYQPGQPDAYYHRYKYDSDNRLVEVFSGRDSVMLFLFPERDGKYNYYKHGLLAQKELGQLRIQKQDYAYTLGAWLKSINPALGGTLANGIDTTEAYPVGQDVYGVSLNYFNKDYTAIGFTPQSTTVLGALGANTTPLFNGNIAATVVSIPQLGASKVYSYNYDQLNRLVAMDVFDGLNVNAGSFTPVNIADYRERITYDANGNITTYQRNGDDGRLSMDNLTYFYKSNTNQIHKVIDGANDVAVSDYSKYNDLKQNQSDNNYQYDLIGNLISDANESISNITWNLYGKVQSITKSGQTIRFSYDAAGNRIFKFTPTDTTVYVRDASGNVLSVYLKSSSAVLAQGEVHLYGSGRLGMTTQHLQPDTVILLSNGFNSGMKSTFSRGEKLFELTNHLGNVMATVADRKIGVDANADGTIEYFKGDIVSANDYYPGGMLMPKRMLNSVSYRYSMNGQEKENELNRNITTALYWEYDSRIMRRWNIDPEMKEGESPYLCFANNPIFFSDVLGNVPGDPKQQGKEPKQTSLNESQLSAAIFSALNSIHSNNKYKTAYFLSASTPENKKPYLGLDIYDQKTGKFFTENFGVTAAQMNDFVNAYKGYYNNFATIGMWFNGVETIAELYKAMHQVAPEKRRKLADDFIKDFVAKNERWTQLSEAGVTYGNILLMYGGQQLKVGNGIKAPYTAPKNVPEIKINLNDALAKVGGNTAVSKFLGWGNRTEILKSAADFTKDQLVKAGYTKEVLTEIAKALRQAARKTLGGQSGQLNPASIARAEQVEQIIKTHF